VRVISRAAIAEFAERYPDALEPLLRWYRVTKRATWRSLMETREDFSHADSVGIFTVFDIAGNHFRLIAVFKYRWQVLYIREILTHREYDKDKGKS
jgi:mRNA interferase HigB